MTGPQPADGAPDPRRPEDGVWRRTSARSLVVAPLRSAVDMLPAILPMVLLALNSGGVGALLLVPAAVLPVVVAVLTWWMTSYRVTSEQFQVRRGVLRRTTLTANLPRIRTVDLSASLLRRLLRLVDLEVSTGADHAIKLTGLLAADAHALRRTLLAHSALAGTTSIADQRQAGPVLEEPATQDPSATQESAGSARRESATQGSASSAVRELARFETSWLILAPLTLSGVAAVGAALAFLAQFGERWAVRTWLWDAAIGAWDSASRMHPLVAFGQASVAALVVVSVLSLISYALRFWGYRLTARDDGTLRVTRGLLTTYHTSLEERRLRGAVLERPLLLRLGQGARARALITGASEGESGSNRASDLLCPPAPRQIAERVIADVLGTEAAMRCALVRHGAAAARRRYTRAAAGAVVLLAVLWVVLAWRGGPPWLFALAALVLPLSPLLAEGRRRELGHALTEDHLVASEGIFPAARSMLRRPAIIGWTLHASWFQRRAGLVTLEATMAAKGGAVRILDVPRPLAVALIAAASPGLVTRYLAPGRTGPAADTPPDTPADSPGDAAGDAPAGATNDASAGATNDAPAGATNDAPAGAADPPGPAAGLIPRAGEGT